MIIQPVVDIAEICARKGVEQAVLSPGSRCAPLTIAFARHPKVQVRTVSDERAAAFIALGIALTTGKPTVLVCSSGTAALNYAPAVAEAFYQQVPLLVLTADRPPEWIDQLDGQTIRQQNIFGQHIKQSYTFPIDFSHPDAQWHGNRMVSEALNQATAYPCGPVHINVPLREPFYPTPGEKLRYTDNLRVISEEQPVYTLPEQQLQKLQQEAQDYRRVLVLAGHGQEQEPLLQRLRSFADKTGAVVVGDIISNTHTLTDMVRHQDAIFANTDKARLAQLQPDLLITFGKSTISKALKIYLRQHHPKAHWHLQPAGEVADTFQALTKIIRCSPEAFLEGMAPGMQSGQEFAQQWQIAEVQAKTFLENYTSEANYSELHAVARVMAQLPQQSNLHLANSMSVRYANIVGLQPVQQVQVYANRGTSGIDGSTSTAVGTALSSPGITTLLTGDLAFFYDRNGLWHNYLPPNLRIVLLNNHAGGIFRLIDGPRSQPELKPYFETEQSLNAENTARDFNMNYRAIHNLQELEQALPSFFAPEAGAGILEIVTDTENNAAAFEAYRAAVCCLPL